MRLQHSTYLVLALSLLLGLTRPTFAQEEQPANGIAITATAGYEGVARPGVWLPVTVTISNEGPAVEGRLRVLLAGGFGAEPATYETAVTLGQQANKRVTLYVFPGSVNAPLTVTLVDERGRELATTRTDPLRSLEIDNLLYGVVSPNAANMEFLSSVTGNRGRAMVAFLSLEDLPELGTAWSALDVLVLSNADAGRLAPEQHEALRQWIATGGVLVLTGGPQWAQNAAGLEDLLPVALEGTQSVAALPALEPFATGETLAPGPYLVTTSSLRRGELLIRQDGLPLLARTPIGRGAVFFLALDPALAPLAGWEGSEGIWSLIAAGTPRTPSWARGASSGLSASEAISRLPVASLPSPLLITCFLSLYVLAVGPLNYLILRRRGRRELAWFTIPALILLFSGCTYVAGVQARGREAILNRMTVAFGSVDGEYLRTHTLLGLYSPRRATYDLLLPAGTLARPFNGETNSMLAEGNVSTSERDGRYVLADVRADVAEIRTLVVDGYAPAPELSGAVTLRDQGDGRPLVAEITVSNNGTGRYEHLTLLLGELVTGLGELGPTEKITVSRAMTVTTPVIPAPLGGLPRPVYSTAPLAENASILLGTADYFTDQEAFPRWQLLNALGGFETPSGWYPQNVATLAAWGEDSLLEVDLAESEYARQGTTFYLLELPTRVDLGANGPTTIPDAAWSWSFLSKANTVIDQEPFDLYLPPGFISFEFAPWSQFQGLAVTDLALVLEPGTAGGGQTPPRLELWDWTERAWLEVEVAGWDRTEVESAARFLDPTLRLRLRVTNDGPAGVDIGRVYPELAGHVEPATAN